MRLLKWDKTVGFYPFIFMVGKDGNKFIYSRKCCEKSDQIFFTVSAVMFFTDILLIFLLSVSLMVRLRSVRYQREVR